MKAIRIVAAAALLAAPALAQETPAPAPDTPAATDMKVDTTAFVKQVPSSNAFEIASSRLAEQMAQSPEVKAFAAQMIEDHTKAGEAFEAARAQLDTTASTTIEGGTRLLPKEQAMLDELKAAEGQAFDQKYIELQTNAHREAVALFSNYAKSDGDPALMEFAKKTLPTLEQHYRHVQELAAGMRG